MVSEEQQDDPTPPRPAAARNEVAGPVTGPVLQAGAVHGDIYVRGSRRSSMVPRWLWVTAGLTVVAVIAYVVLVSLQPQPPEQTSAARPEVLRVNDVSDLTADAYEYEVFWATGQTPAADRIGKVRTRADLPQLMESTGGVPVGRAAIGVVLEGMGTESVIVQQITARIVATTDALSDTMVVPPEVGGPGPKYILGFDLDESDPQARIPDVHGVLGARFSDDNYFEVGPGEKYVFTFFGIVKSAHTYRWVVDVRFLVGDQHRILTVGQDRPFAVTGPAHSYRHVYGHTNDSGEGLARVDPRTVCPTGDCTANAEKWARI